ncbi:hypothetical protein LWI29_002961 [Acer saccharum]|uniref:Uncharacterized protein n=1 Tax=Acer saccharum TaxID=4024 RepID=A0AA39T1R2_ACESA|nr:hypothetical protein LWI29_002961 [Acer saccharum]
MLEGPNGKDSIKEAVVRKSLVRIDGSIVKGVPVLAQFVINFKEVWNLEDEVTRVLEKGLALGLDLNGRKKELIEIIARREEENDSRFRDLVRRLVQNHKAIGH